MRTPASTSRRLVRIAVSAAVLSNVVLLAGCSLGEPRPIGPAGVDGLQIPTPSPRPGDFVSEVDNPWFPLAPGSVWSYAAADSPQDTVSVTVELEQVEIAGVMTTPVTTAASSADVSTRYYAQDVSGNVWTFGADDWRAGEDGAQAGLVMPATPRVGDGFVQTSAPGVAEEHSLVLDVAATVASDNEEWTDAVEVQETSQMEPETEAVRFYVPGLGLVRSETSDGVIDLVDYAPGN